MVKNNEVLNFNKSYINHLVKERFEKISNYKNDEFFNKYIDELKGKCVYSIYDNVKKEKNILTIENISMEAEFFRSIPKEIVKGGVVYAVTVGDISGLKTDAEGILEETMIDYLATAYIDVLRMYLREELEDEYLIGTSVTPGISTAIDEIKKLETLVDMNVIGTTINDYLQIIPEKSACGILLIYEQAHPEHKNDCNTCMARGSGCNLCIQGADDV